MKQENWYLSNKVSFLSILLSSFDFHEKKFCGWICYKIIIFLQNFIEMSWLKNWWASTNPGKPGNPGKRGGFWIDLESLETKFSTCLSCKTWKISFDSHFLVFYVPSPSCLNWWFITPVTVVFWNRYATCWDQESTCQQESNQCV